MKARSLCVVAAVAAFLRVPAASAQTTSGEAVARSEAREVADGLASSFSLPLGDLMKKKHESEWRNLFDGLAGSLGADGPLTAPAVAGHGSGLELTDARLSATVKYTPLSYWFASVSVYRYLNSAVQRPWNPDFTFVLGYDDWHPYTLSLQYANYGGNRFRPSGSAGGRTEFEEGGITLGWKLKSIERVERALAVTSSGGVSLSLNYTWTPRYTDAEAHRGSWKQKAGLTGKYTIYKSWYATATVYHYPDASQQQPWDPDFTYGFGYFDWHPKSWSIQYNNYAGNRYPWHHGAGTGLRDGSVSLTWSWSSEQ